MGENAPTPSIDMIRWTFRVDDANRSEVETYLSDLGVDVVVMADGQFHVNIDDPDRDLDEVVTELWALNGHPFDITQETFHRLSLLMLHHDEADEAQAA